MVDPSEKTAEWLYRGIWRRIAEWFVVPEEPPTLPARPDEKIRSFRPSPDFVRYLKLWFWIGLFLVDLLLLVAWIASFFAAVWLGVALTPVFLVAMLLLDLVAYAAVHLRYDTTWYVLSDRSLRIRRGIWVIRETTITFENVQDIKIQQGPIQRHFGIGNVIVSTAGGGGGAPQQQGGVQSTAHQGLLEGVGDARAISEQIMSRVRRSRSSGLSDDEMPPTHMRGGWTAEHVEVLRGIREEVSSLRSEGSARTTSRPDRN